MTWIRVDDRFDEHPKHARVGPLGWGVWLAGLAYCNRNLTDGFIPRSIARTLADFHVEDGDTGVLWTVAITSGMRGDDVTMRWVCGLLVRAGLWLEVPGGYQIHDYGDYQPTKEEVEAAREQRRQAGQRGGLAKAKRTAKRGAKQTAKQTAKQNPSDFPSKTLPQTRTQDHAQRQEALTPSVSELPSYPSNEPPLPDNDQPEFQPAPKRPRWNGADDMQTVGQLTEGVEGK